MTLFHLVFIASILVTFSSGALIDEAQILYDTLNEVTQNASNTALQELWYQTEHISEYADDVKSITGPQIESAADKLFEGLNDIKTIAAAADVNISECLETYEYLINSTINIAWLELNTCTNDGVLNVYSYVGECLALINNLIEDTFATERDLFRCDRSDDVCIANVIDIINFQIVDIPRKINVQKNAGLAFAEGLKIAIAWCGLEEIAEIDLNGGIYLNYIEECVSNIINQRTSTEASTTITKSSQL